MKRYKVILDGVGSLILKAESYTVIDGILRLYDADRICRSVFAAGEWIGIIEEQKKEQEGNHRPVWIRLDHGEEHRFAITAPGEDHIIIDGRDMGPGNMVDGDTVPVIDTVIDCLTDYLVKTTVV